MNWNLVGTQKFFLAGTRYSLELTILYLAGTRRYPKFFSLVPGTQRYPTSEIFSIPGSHRYPNSEIFLVPGTVRFWNFEGYRPLMPTPDLDKMKMIFVLE